MVVTILLCYAKYIIHAPGLIKNLCEIRFVTIGDTQINLYLHKKLFFFYFFEST